MTRLAVGKPKLETFATTHDPSGGSALKSRQTEDLRERQMPVTPCAKSVTLNIRICCSVSAMSRPHSMPVRHSTISASTRSQRLAATTLLELRPTRQPMRTGRSKLRRRPSRFNTRRQRPAWRYRHQRPPSSDCRQMWLRRRRRKSPHNRPRLSRRSR